MMTLQIPSRPLLFLFGLSLILSPFVGFASEEPVLCEDLYSYSCSPGEVNDGTGKAKNQDVLDQMQLPRIAKMGERAVSAFEERLKGAEAAYFRRTVLAATGLSAHPSCRNGAQSPSDACMKLMAEGSKELLLRQFVGMPNPLASAYSAGKLSNRALLLDSPAFQEVREQLIKEELNNPEVKLADERIRTRSFAQLKASVIEKLERAVPDKKVRERMIEKIRAIQFGGFDCRSDSSGPMGAASIPSLFMSNAFYHPTQNKIKLCAGMMENTSDFALAQVIVHEFSHAVDPCNITLPEDSQSFKYKGMGPAETDLEYPIPGLLSCLRDPRSVGAQSLAALRSGASSQTDDQDEDRPPEERFGQGGLGGGLGLPGAQVTPPTNLAPYCQGDQVNEAFCDWLAAEVVPDYIAKNYPRLSKEQYRNGYSNIWRGSCGEEDSGAGQNPYQMMTSTHPKTRDRANKILLTHPGVRKQMGCQKLTDSSRISCSLDDPQSPVALALEGAKKAGQNQNTTEGRK